MSLPIFIEFFHLNCLVELGLWVGDKGAGEVLRGAHGTDGGSEELGVEPKSILIEEKIETKLDSS